MRGVFGLAGLLVALLIVALLVKNQLTATQQAAPALQRPAAQGAADQDTAPTGSVKQQSRQIEQQYKSDLESALHKARPESSNDSQ